MKIETPIFSIVIILLISGVIANEPNLDKIKLEKAALFSFAAYCPEQRLIQWNCHWCQKVQDRVRVVKTINDAEKQNFAYVAASDKYYIVSFRGTVKGIQNWISNLNATMVQFGNNLAKVHRGFYGTWQFYENDIYEALYDLERKEGKKPILVTGHSRGGAIASIAAIELARRGLDVEHLTFGQPRVGDTGFMRLFNNLVKKTFRMVNRLDIVSRIPSIILQYYHVPREVWVKEDGTVKICALDEDLTCSRSIDLHRLRVDDHMIYMGHNLKTGMECSTA